MLEIDRSKFAAIVDWDKEHTWLSPEPLSTQALDMLYGLYEKGTDCYEDPENEEGHMGVAVKLTPEQEDAIIFILCDAGMGGEQPCQE